VTRWPIAVFAAALLVLTLLSSLQYCRFEAHHWKTSVRLDFWNGAIIARLVYAPSFSDRGPTWNIERVSMPALEWRWPGSYSGWWCLELVSRNSGSTRLESAAFPAWCIFLPLGALSWAGFRAKRRLTIPAGACPSCRHPLAGAIICPECGAATRA